MEIGNLQNLDVNRGHEPVGIPLNRPPGTFSPTGGEGRDEGVRFMGSLVHQTVPLVLPATRQIDADRARPLASGIWRTR